MKEFTELGALKVTTQYVHSFFIEHYTFHANFSHLIQYTTKEKKKIDEPFKIRRKSQRNMLI